MPEQLTKKNHFDVIRDTMEPEIFQVVWLPNFQQYQVSCRQLLGVHAMTHHITSYLTQKVPIGWEKEKRYQL